MQVRVGPDIAAEGELQVLEAEALVWVVVALVGQELVKLLELEMALPVQGSQLVVLVALEREPAVLMGRSKGWVSQLLGLEPAPWTELDSELLWVELGLELVLRAQEMEPDVWTLQAMQQGQGAVA